MPRSDKPRLQNRKSSSVYQGSGQPFFAAVRDSAPLNMATKKAKGELVVMPARKKAKHSTAKRFL